MPRCRQGVEHGERVQVLQENFLFLTKYFIFI